MNKGDEIYSTAPPAASSEMGERRLRRKVSQRLSSLLTPLAQRVARDHFGGDTVDDAICVARRLATDRIPNTLGFWPIGDESERDMADLYIASIDALAASDLSGYLSIKPPAFGFNDNLAAEIAASARNNNVQLHCDSHGIESVDPSHQMIEKLLGCHRPPMLGTTLPGRWSRSLEDADWAIDRDLNIRVVKGQWPDPDEPERDMRQGFLDVIDRLAGRARHVAVASHDLPLLAEAITLLRSKSGSFEVEVIYGMPLAPILDWARKESVTLRVYVPYGKGFVPNAIGQLRRNPRLAWRLVKGMVLRRDPSGTR